MAAKPRPAEKPNYSPPVFVAPPPGYLPAGVTARAPGIGEMPAPPVVKARRLVVVDRDGEHVTIFDPQLGGSLTVYGGGLMPSAPWSNEGIAGRFSPVGTIGMEIVGEAPDRRLVVVEQLSEPVERVIAIDEAEPPSLLVEVVVPNEREPWVEVTEATRFELDRVTSIALGDVD